MMGKRRNRSPIPCDRRVVVSGDLDPPNLGRFGCELSKDNLTFVQRRADSAHRVVTDLGCTVSMRCELEDTLKSRQHRRETPDFSFRHRPNCQS
jgi:hypothetical protein